MQKQDKTNKKGFTLAEVLITLGIMGLIMALTIPTLLRSTSKAGYVAGLQKTYGMLDQAITQIMISNSGTMINALDSVSSVETKFCNILECNKFCGAGTVVSDGCFHAQTAAKTLYGANLWFNPADAVVSAAGFVLADGALVLINPANAEMSRLYSCNLNNYGLLNICGWVFVDVNGFNSPNVVGRDIFTFYLNKDGIFPMGQQGLFTDSSTWCNPSNNGASSGNGCTARVLNESAINY